MDSISLGFSSCIPDFVGIPSITYKGSVLFKVPTPRITTFVFAPLGEPSDETFTPAILPCNALIGFGSGCFIRSFILTTATAPVISAFFC